MLGVDLYMELKIAICDDDMSFVDKLDQKVNEIVKSNNCTCNIAKLYDEKELIKYSKENTVDIILTDIDMSDTASNNPTEFLKMGGFNAAQQLQKMYPETEIMFVSAHEELAYQSFRYRPFSFVSKCDMGRLDEDLGELIKKIKIRRNNNLFAPLTVDGKTYSINVNEIIYFKNEKHYIYAYTVNGREKAYRCSIKDAYNQLKDAYFICVHRSYLLNCRYIRYFDAQNVIMCNDEKINVTRDENRLKEAQKIFVRHKRSLR